MEISNKTVSKLRREGKCLLRDGKHRLGLYDNFYTDAHDSRILIYYSVCQVDHTRFNPIFLTQQTFEQHLRLYKKHTAGFDTF